MHLNQVLERYLPLISNMLFSAIVFAVGLFYFLLNDDISFERCTFFHWGFYSLAVLSLIIMLNFNRGKSLFLVVINIVSYVLLNYFKNLYGPLLQQSSWFQILNILFPLNILLFYLWQTTKFISSRSLMMLIVILAQYSVVELFVPSETGLNLTFYNINVFAIAGYSIIIIWALVKSIKTGSLFDYTVLYSSISTCIGFYCSSTPQGLSLFFFLSMLMLTAYLIYTLIYNHFYDELTGFYSRNSYLIQSKHFPLKYSLGIVSIDNYDKLRLTFGRAKQEIITSLIAEMIQEQAQEETIFRYAPDQFIVLYKKLDKKETVSHIDNIRRNIAGASFTWSDSQKPLKLTVSCSVAEKKRSDTSAVEVLMRADKAMRKTLKFSHNVTSQG